MIGIIPNVEGTEHGSTRYRCYEVVRRCPNLFEIFQPSRAHLYRILLHERTVKAQYLYHQAQHWVDLSDLPPSPLFDSRIHGATTPSSHLRRLLSATPRLETCLLPDLVVCPDLPWSYQAKFADRLTLGLLGTWNPEVVPCIRAVLERIRAPLRVRLFSHAETYYQRLWVQALPDWVEYVRWDWRTLWEDLSSVNVLLVASPVTEFFQCKGPNRLVLATACGVPVVGPATTSYLELIPEWCGRTAQESADLVDSFWDEQDLAPAVLRQQQERCVGLYPLAATNFWESFGQAALLRLP